MSIVFHLVPTSISEPARYSSHVLCYSRWMHVQLFIMFSPLLADFLPSDSRPRNKYRVPLLLVQCAHAWYRWKTFRFSAKTHPSVDVKSQATCRFFVIFAWLPGTWLRDGQPQPDRISSTTPLSPTPSGITLLASSPYQRSLIRMFHRIKHIQRPFHTYTPLHPHRQRPPHTFRHR